MIEVDTLKPIITKRPDENFFVQYHNSLIFKLKQKQEPVPVAESELVNSKIEKQLR
jgi:hypothetical protein